MQEEDFSVGGAVIKFLARCKKSSPAFFPSLLWRPLIDPFKMEKKGEMSFAPLLFHTKKSAEKGDKKGSSIIILKRS